MPRHELRPIGLRLQLELARDHLLRLGELRPQPAHLLRRLRLRLLRLAPRAFDRRVGRRVHGGALLARLLAVVVEGRGRGRVRVARRLELQPRSLSASRSVARLCCASLSCAAAASALAACAAPSAASDASSDATSATSAWRSASEARCAATSRALCASSIACASSRLSFRIAARCSSDCSCRYSFSFSTLSRSRSSRSACALRSRLRASSPLALSSRAFDSYAFSACRDAALTAAFTFSSSRSSIFFASAVRESASRWSAWSFLRWTSANLARSASRSRHARTCSSSAPSSSITECRHTRLTVVSFCRSATDSCRTALSSCSFLRASSWSAPTLAARCSYWRVAACCSARSRSYDATSSPRSSDRTRSAASTRSLARASWSRSSSASRESEWMCSCASSSRSDDVTAPPVEWPPNPPPPNGARFSAAPSGGSPPSSACRSGEGGCLTIAEAEVAGGAAAASASGTEIGLLSLAITAAFSASGEPPPWERFRAVDTIGPVRTVLARGVAAAAGVCAGKRCSPFCVCSQRKLG